MPDSTLWEREAVYVGIDYHQDSVQVCVLDARGRVRLNRGCVNDWSAVAGAAQACGVVRRAAVEACCGSADLAEQLVECAGWSVDLAHPGYVARLKGSPDKSDFSDAHLLADLTRVGYLPRVWLAPRWVRELRRLVRYRQQQVDARRNVKLRLGALLRDHRLTRPIDASPWTRRWRAWLTTPGRLPAASAWIVERHLQHIDELNAEVRRVERRLHAYTAEDQVTQALLDLPEIGPVTAWVLRAEVGRFDRFNSGKQLARFCGLSPRNASSGQRQADAGLIKAGSSLLRSTLIELAHRVGRLDDRWSTLKRDLRAAGKPANVATAAVANRWVRRLYARMTEPLPGQDRPAISRRDDGALAGPLG